MGLFVDFLCPQRLVAEIVLLTAEHLVDCPTVRPSFAIATPSGPRSSA